jgi:uncharacterized protein with von Willebrand factor type A (vWA) domain
VFNFPGGGTDFNPALNMGLDGILQHINSKDKGELHFFTDGEANYPN